MTYKGSKKEEERERQRRRKRGGGEEERGRKREGGRERGERIHSVFQQIHSVHTVYIYVYFQIFINQAFQQEILRITKLLTIQ